MSAPLEIGARDRKVIDAACEMGRATASAYMPSVFCQVFLPHRDPGADVKTWDRDSGTVRMHVHSPHGIPFGNIPRLAIWNVCTQAKLKKTRVVSLGRSPRAFIKALELGGTSSREYERVFEQTRRLFTSAFWQWNTGDICESFEGWMLADRGILWQPHGLDSEWESTLVLNDVFYQSLLSTPPADFRAIQALRRSSLSLDIYLWLPYRIFLLNKLRQGEVRIPWERLQSQFGSNYDTKTDFRKNFEKQLRRVLCFYPEARSSVVVDRHHLIVRSCRLHILEKQGGWYA